MIARPPLAALGAHERLHARDDNRRVEACVRVRHFDLGGETCDGADFVHGLADEFLAVCEHERPPRLIDGREMREHDGLAAAGGEHEQLALILREAALNRFARGDLIAPQGDVRRGCCHRPWAWRLR